MRNDEEVQSGIYKSDLIDLEHVIKSVKSNINIKKAGSIHTFTGIVRDTSSSGKSVIGMTIDAYDELANRSITNICNQLKKENGIIDVKIVHLKGEFDLSDDLVYVVVASAHRNEGFEVIRKAVEMYKKELAVWKKEYYEDETSEWVH